MIRYLKSLFTKAAETLPSAATATAVQRISDGLVFSYTVSVPSLDCIKEASVYIDADKAVASGRYEVLDQSGDMFDRGTINVVLSAGDLRTTKVDDIRSLLAKAVSIKLGFQES